MRGFGRRACSAAAGAICVFFAVGSGAAIARAQFSLTQVSSDPFTNATSFHATELEPDNFAFGSTVVSAFQSGRFSDGGASDIGWATSKIGRASCREREE